MADNGDDLTGLMVGILESIRDIENFLEGTGIRGGREGLGFDLWKADVETGRRIEREDQEREEKDKREEKRLREMGLLPDDYDEDGG